MKLPLRARERVSSAETVRRLEEGFAYTAKAVEQHLLMRTCVDANQEAGLLDASQSTVKAQREETG